MMVLRNIAGLLVSLFFVLDRFSLSIFHVRYVLIHIDVDQI